MKSNIKESRFSRKFVFFVPLLLSIAAFSQWVSKLQNEPSIKQFQPSIKQFQPSIKQFQPSIKQFNATLKAMRVIKFENGKVLTNKLLHNYSQPSAFYHAFQVCRIPKWESIIDPCKNNMKWEERARDTGQRTKSKYSKVDIEVPLDGMPGRIEISTFDRQNRRKSRGGDHWRAKLQNKDYSLSIQFMDQNNGRYIGYFAAPTAGKYKLNIVLEHSLCEGLTNQPSDWFRKGNLHGDKQPAGTIGYVDQFLNEPIREIEVGIPTNQHLLDRKDEKDTQSCTVINRNCGYWKYGRFVGYDQTFKAPSLNYNKRLGTLWVYGDSLSYRFLDSLKGHTLCRKIFKKCLKRYTWTYQHFNKDIHIDLKLKTKVDFNEKKFINDIKADILQPDMRTKNSVFIVNFGVHNIGNIPLTRAFNLFQLFIEMVKNVQTDLKAENTPLIIWKTTTPPIIENAKYQNLTDFRFVTKQRIEVWNSYTIKEACKANIPVLDIYKMALSIPFRAVDHIHYPNPTFRSAEDDLMYFIGKRIISQK